MSGRVNSSRRFDGSSIKCFKCRLSILLKFISGNGVADYSVIPGYLSLISGSIKCSLSKAIMVFIFL
jgi:hypothetical protein